QERTGPAAVEQRDLSPHDELQARLEALLEKAFRQLIAREGREVLELVERFVGKRANPAELVALLRRYYEEARWMAEDLLQPFMEAARAGVKLGVMEAGAA